MQINERGITWGSKNPGTEGRLGFDIGIARLTYIAWAEMHFGMYSICWTDAQKLVLGNFNLRRNEAVVNFRGFAT